MVLVVEDDADTREAVEMLLQQEGFQVATAHDGSDALRQLRAGLRPGLILLDLNLPKKAVREVLGAIKQDPKLKRIPVVVLTSSEAESDIVRSYDLHANCYMCKPVDLTRFLDTVRKIEEFWLTVVRLPHQK